LKNKLFYDYTGKDKFDPLPQNNYKVVTKLLPLVGNIFYKRVDLYRNTDDITIDYSLKL